MVESLGRDMVTTVYLYFGSQSGLSQRHDAALVSEFLSYAEGDTDTAKQDCELKAFKRLVVKNYP